jgi:integrase/recombinase XerD
MVFADGPRRKDTSMQGEDTTVGVGGEEKITSLEARMIADLSAREYSPLTQKIYLRAVRHLSRHYNDRSVEEISVSEARCYLRVLKQRGASVSTVGNHTAGIRFLFEVTFGKVWQPVSPLRQRMLEDMDLRGFSVRTQDSYVRSVANLARYWKRSPDTLCDEEIRRYFVHLKCERKLARQTVTIALCGIKFLIESTLKRDFSLTGVPVPKRRKTLPVVLSKGEVRAILCKVRTLRFRACLTLIYVCGLRLGEACRLAPTDIDSARGVVMIRNAKGGTDRQVPLPVVLLPVLREFWKTHRNPRWLFPAQSCGHRRGSPAERHMPLGAVQKAFKLALKASGLRKAAHVHTLRHSYATHLLEANVPVRSIQDWLGHRSPATTSCYTHITAQGAVAAAQRLNRLMSDL